MAAGYTRAMRGRGLMLWRLGQARAGLVRSPLDRVRSPFPGMDPYLEGRWADVHMALNVYVAEAIQRSLPLALRSRVVNQLMVLDGGTAAADPVVMVVDTTANFRLVTVIELLRAPHKVPGEFHDAYLGRLRRYAAEGVNVVEVDLLRSPRIGMAVSRSTLSPTHRTPYLICVERASDPTRWACYPVPLRHRIRPVPLPLRPGDPDGTLDLQPLLTRAYAAGRHDDIDYRKEPDPPLPEADVAWADTLLRAARRR